MQSPDPGLGQAGDLVSILNAVTVNKDSGTFCWGFVDVALLRNLPGSIL